MFEIYRISVPEVIGFVLVLLRISSFVIAMPVFGSENIPTPLKILFSLVIAMTVHPTLVIQAQHKAIFEQAMIWMALREVAIGLILGFVARLFFFSLTISGELLSISIGLSSEQLMNPALGGRVTAIQQFQVLIGTIFFLAINGHYYLIAGLVKSFEVIPLTARSIEMLSDKQIGLMCQEIVMIGIKMSAPTLAVILFMNIMMAILGRAVPQINVLITSLPVNAMVGFILVIASIPLLLIYMDGVAHVTATRLFQIMKEL